MNTQHEHQDPRNPQPHTRPTMKQVRAEEMPVTRGHRLGSTNSHHEHARSLHLKHDEGTQPRERAITTQLTARPHAGTPRFTVRLKFGHDFRKFRHLRLHSGSATSSENCENPYLA